MNKYLSYLFILIAISFNTLSFGQNTILKSKSKSFLNKFWFEFQTTQSYRNNDFYIKSFNNYYLSDFTSRLGLKAYSSNGFVIEPYIKSSLINDFLNNIWNDVDWHNNYVIGLGCRFRQSLKSIDWISNSLRANEFNIDLIGEKLLIGYLKKNQFYVGHRPHDDLKIGIQYWFDLGTLVRNDYLVGYDKFLYYCWIESSGGFFYNKNNFYVKSLHNFYLLTLNNKIGIQIPIYQLRIKPYIKQELCRDFGNQDWNHLEWLNYLHYGIGLRINYVPKEESSNENIKIIINPFIEYLKVAYLNNVSYIPSYRPKYDFRFGIDLWFSIKGKGN